MNKIPAQKEELRLLLLEDTREDAFLIRKTLERSGLMFVMHVVSTEEEFLSALHQSSFDLIMTDNDLPQFNATEALRIINEQQTKIPCIVVTGTTSDELAVELMKKGACDYIMKDRLNRLPNSITNAVNNSRLEKADQIKLADIIKHKELMREAEALAHFGSWENDFVNDLSYWSDETFRILGYEPGEVTPSANNLMAKIHPDDLDHVTKAVDAAKAHLHHIKYSFRVMPQSGGQVKFVTAQMFITRDDAGKIIRTHGLIQDETERKIAERKITAAERKYRNLFENSPVPMWVINERTSQFKTVNNAAINHYGYSRAEFLSMTAIDIRPGEEKEKYLAIEHNKDRYGNIGIWKHQKKDGTVIYVEIILDAIMYEEERSILVIANDITERARAEKKLKHTTQRLKQAQEIAHIGSWEHDLVNDKLTWTDEMYRIYGLSPEDDIRNFRNFITYIHPDDLEFVLRQIDYSYSTLSGSSYRHRLIRKTGEVRHVHAQFEYEFDNEGNPVMRYGVVQDITEIITAENNLLHIAERLKQAQAIAHIGSWELDIKTGIAIWSDEACKIFGLPPKENTQSFDSFLSFVHPDDMASTLKSVKESNEIMSPAAFTHRIIRNDGSIRHVYTHGEFELNSYGEPIFLHGITHDITDIKESEQALQQSEANLRLIMDLLPQTISVRNFKGEFLYANKLFASLYGVHPEDLLGLTVREMIPAGNIPEDFLHRDQEVITTNEIKVMPEATFTDRNGEIKTYTVTKVPFTPAGQKERAVLGIGHDITERKKAESERRKMTADIVKRNIDLEQFSYIVSHNLRAPIANLLGINDLIDREQLTIDEKLFLLKGFSESVKKLDNVIIDLNHVTQVKHSVNENREIIACSAIVNEIRKNIQTLAGGSDITICADFDEIDSIYTVSNYMHSIFYNLITNSLKHKKHNLPVTCEIKSQKLPGVIKLTFKDNGKGIDLKKSGDHVFEMYKRFHIGATDSKGMGLFMVKTYVESLGGKITVAGELNYGTQFTIELPLAEPV